MRKGGDKAARGGVTNAEDGTMLMVAA